MKTTSTLNHIFRTFSRLQRSCCSALFLLLFLLGANSSWGQIAQRGSATTAISTSASVTVNKPTGVVSGDIMIANIGNYFDGTNSSASSSGWTLIAGTDLSRGRATLLYKIAGGSEPTSYTFAVTTSSLAATGAIVAFSGVNTTTPFDVTAASSWFTAQSTTLSSIPSITTANPNAAVLMFGNCTRVTTQTNANFTNAGWTLTSPALLTELYDVGHNNQNNRPCVGAVWALRPTAGATGAGGLNCNVNTSPRTLGGITIALRPCVIVSAGSALSAICRGGTSAQLGGSVSGSTTAGTWSDGGAGGSFSPNATTLNATYTPLSTYTGTVTLTLTSSGGSCGTATATKTLTVTAPNAATISYEGTTFCRSLTTGQAVILTGTTGGTYSSTTGLTISSLTGAITPSTSTAGTYTVTYTMAAAGECSNATATRIVTVTAAPNAGTLSGTQAICAAGTTILSSTISGGTWSSGATGIATINTTTGVVTGVSAGTATMTYTVAGTGGCGNATVTRTVTVSPASVGGTATANVSAVCIGSGTSIALAGYAGTIQWQQSANGTSGWANVTTGSGGTSATYITPNLATTTYYRASVTSGSCTLANSNVVEVTVKPLPIATITANYCAVAGKIQLTAGGGGTYSWNTGENINPILVDVAGIYSVTTTVLGCTGTAFLNVAQELVIDGSFTNFNAASPSFFTQYTQQQAFYTGITTSGLWPEGTYAVNTSAYSPPPYGVGYHPLFYGKDHTNNTTGSRNFLMVNGSTSLIPNPPGPDSQRIIWQQTVTVTPNTDYYFSAWAMNLNPNDPAQLQFEVNGVLVGSIADLSLPTVPKPTTESQVNLLNWVRFYNTTFWKSDTATTAIIRIRNLSTTSIGNDFGLDDISFGTLSAVQFSISPGEISGTANSTLCAGQTFNLSANLTNGKEPITYSWTGPNGFKSNLANPTISNVSTANAGDYTLTVTDGYGCGSQTKTATLTVNARPTSVVSGTATTCDGTAKTISVALTGTGPWNLTYTDGTTPVSITEIAYSPYTFSVTPTSTKTYTVTALSDSKCTAIVADMTGSAVVTVSPATVGGTVSGGATVCTGTNSTVLTLSGHTGSITRWESSLNNFATTSTIANTTTTLTATNLSATTSYRAVLTSGACDFAISASATVTVNSSNTWIGTPNSSWFTALNWSCESIPTANTDVIIPNGSQLIVDDTSTIALANTITVSASSSLTVNSGNTLKVTDKVTNNDGGTITFEDTASLVQTNNVANSGNIIYKRTTSKLNNNYDFVYWSSPVAAQQIGLIWMASNWADTFYNYNPGTPGWARSYATTPMIAGKGYIARARYGQSLVDNDGSIISEFTTEKKWPAKFNGVPNNGKITVTDCKAGKYYLLGNPYPSAIDAFKFLDLPENKAVLEGTLYFWTHNTALANNAYNSNDYASYNSSGSVATAARGNLVSGDPNDNNKPTGKIAAGQSFFAKAKVTGEVTFNNTMRLSTVGAPLDNTQFFRTSSAKAKTANSIEKNRVWLNVSNTQGAFKQALVGYVTDATNAYDSRFDGESFGGNSYVDFYSINENKNLTIQGRALPFDQNDTVPLGFKTTIEGSFTIDIDEVDGLLTNQAVYLEDKVTNTVSNLKNGNYTFTTAKGIFNDRFVLRYTDTDTTLSIDDTDQEDGILVFYSNNYKTLIIKNKVMDSTVNSVALFNMAGQNIEKWVVKDSGQTNIQIPIKNTPSGIYIVKVKTTKGESSKKIIVN